MMFNFGRRNIPFVFITRLNSNTDLTEVRGVLKSIGAQSIKDSSDGGLNIAVDPGVFRLLEDRVTALINHFDKCASSLSCS